MDKIIKVDSPYAKGIGFTSDKFESVSYLWMKDAYIWISFIVSSRPGEGNLSKVFDNILKKGYGIKVPTPFKKMKMILIKKGFKQTYEYFDEDTLCCEVWVKDK